MPMIIIPMIIVPMRPPAPVIVIVPCPIVYGTECISRPIEKRIYHCGIYIDAVTVVIYIPVTYSAIVHQVPIDAAGNKSFGATETNDAFRVAVIIIKIIGIVDVIALIDLFIDLIDLLICIDKITLVGTLYNEHLLCFLGYIVDIVLRNIRKREKQHE